MMDFADWTGRSGTAKDAIRPGPAAALAATLDGPARPWATGDALPPLWHWLYAQPLHRASELGPDGHARLGGFLPPLPTLPLPRRMWAGGRLAFHAPLCIGQRVQRRSRILQVQAKQGRSGPLAFVTVQHAFHGEGAAVGEAPALAEERGSPRHLASQAATLSAFGRQHRLLPHPKPPRCAWRATVKTASPWPTSTPALPLPARQKSCVACTP